MRFPSDETIKTASGSKEDEDLWYAKDTVPWVSNGHFACRVADAKVFSTYERDIGHSFDGLVGKYTDNIRAVNEIPGLYKPWTDAQEEVLGEGKTCFMCNGDGQHVCDCGDEHECGECFGKGHNKPVLKPYAPGDRGQAVYVDDKGAKIAIQARFRLLLDGLVVKATGDEVCPLIGCDPDDGAVVVIVMPYRI